MMKAIGSKVQFGNGLKGTVIGYSTYKFEAEDPSEAATRYVVELQAGSSGWMTPQGNRDPGMYISVALVHPEMIREYTPMTEAEEDALLNHEAMQ